MHCRSYKFRIYPNKEQEIQLKKTIGCCRYIYNWGLEKRRNSWINDSKSYSYEKTCKDLTSLKKEIGWLKEVSSVCLQQSLQNLDTSFLNFFKKKSRYPRFKKRKNGGFARFVRTSFRLKNDDLYLAKIKVPIKIIWSRKLPSEPSSCVVSQNSSNQWFISFVCEEEIEKLPESNKKIGIDLGIESFATLSNGIKINNPPSIKLLRKKISSKQKSFSRKKIDSKNREKARLKLARAHQKIVNIRTDFLQKLSTQLIRENQTIVIEDLAVRDMLKKKELARFIGEQGWRSFRGMLDYKADWYGRELVIVDRFFPSSQTCNSCGKTNKLTLDKRKFACECGVTYNRDVNAAQNILAVGVAVTACGVDGRPVNNYIIKGNRQRSRKPKAQVSDL